LHEYIVPLGVLKKYGNENQTLKVFQLSTGHAGGAGLAARRLNLALNEIGVVSNFYALSHPDFILGEQEYRMQRSWWSRLLSKANLLLSQLLSKKVFFSILSINTINLKVLLGTTNPNLTVLHFHNWYNFVNLRQIHKLLGLGYKIVITLHDERFFTGGCHYTLDCKGFVSNCESCPLVPKIFWGVVKKNRISLSVDYDLSGLQIITPSKWMKNELTKTGIIAPSNIHVLENVFPDYVNQTNTNFIEQQMESTRKIRIGVASMDPEIFVKAGDIYKELVEYIKRHTIEIEIIELREPRFKELGVDRFWTEIDMLLHLSRADNSPNVIKEAKFYGLPVISTNVGGIPEALEGSLDIILDLENIDSKRIIDAIYKVYGGSASKEMKSRISLLATTNSRDSLNKHLSLYRSLVIEELEL